MGAPPSAMVSPVLALLTVAAESDLVIDTGRVMDLESKRDAMLDV